MSNLTSTLSHKECQDFLTAYFEGIMEEGLLQPLEDFAKSNAGRAGLMAQSWFDLQIAGETPQAALSKLKPPLPTSIVRLLSIGFEKSVLDMVLKDILYIYRDNTDQELIENALEKLFTKYSKINTDVVCADCWSDEISKILFRSRIEGAGKVILQQEREDFLHQKYIGPKLVHVTEASISAVFKTLEKNLSDYSASGKELKIGESNFAVEKKGPSDYYIKGTDGGLVISFGTFHKV